MLTQTHQEKQHSLTGAGIQTRPQGGITMTTSSVGKAQVYYSIFGFQLASVTARLAGVHIHIRTDGNLVSNFCDYVFVECGRKQAENHVIKGKADPQGAQNFICSLLQ